MSYVSLSLLNSEIVFRSGRGAGVDSTLLGHRKPKELG